MYLRAHQTVIDYLVVCLPVPMREYVCKRIDFVLLILYKLKGEHMAVASSMPQFFYVFVISISLILSVYFSINEI